MAFPVARPAVRFFISFSFVATSDKHLAGPMTLEALSLFSGIGGFCEGAQRAGISVVGAAELDAYAAVNYRLNFPRTPLYEGDVRDLFVGGSAKRRTQIEALTRRGIVDLVIGGPPCQGYSQIGPRSVGDARNTLYLEMCRIARTVRARAILLENVPNMLRMHRGHFRDRITEALSDAGFTDVAVRTLNAVDYGVPQARQRVFILAVRRKDSQVPAAIALDLVAAAFRVRKCSVISAIGDLPEDHAHDSLAALPYPTAHRPTTFQREMRLDFDGAIYSRDQKLRQYRLSRTSIGLENHHTKEIEEHRLALIKLLAPGAKANSLPIEVWNNIRPQKWRRFDGRKPAHTLTAQMHRDLSEWIHPSIHRWITVREALRLQSFHDGFVLKTSEWQQLKQVGNAVPPLLGRIPAIAARMALTGETIAELREHIHEQSGGVAPVLNAAADAS